MLFSSLEKYEISELWDLFYLRHYSHLAWDIKEIEYEGSKGSAFI